VVFFNLSRVVPELVKKKEARNADFKKKSDEEKLKKKSDKKSKLAECIKRGEKWYKFDLAEKKALIENKRQVYFSLY